MIKPKSSTFLPQLEELSRVISERIGLDFPERKWDVLQRVVENLAGEDGCPDSELFLKELLDSSLSDIRLNQLIVRLTIGETYFLRDKGVFTVLRDQILPSLIDKRLSEKQIDIWCAASSSGEEPYSIAMLLDEKSDQLRGWQLNIQASDLNLDVLEIARKGVYSNWSLRATPEDKKAKYFTEIGENRFSLAPQLRQMVTFSQLNLADSEFVMPGLGGRLADMIFCRNVLIYFSAQLQAQVIKRLVSWLKPGGWLLVAPSELGVVQDPDLVPVRFPGVMVHQKCDARDLGGGRQLLSSGALAPAGASGHNEVYRLQARKMVTRRPVLKPACRLEVARIADGLVHCKGVIAHLDLLTVLNRVHESLAAQSYREIVDLVSSEIEIFAKLEPEYPEIMACKAQALANLGVIDDAVDAIEMALEVDKVNPLYYYLAATIRRELADYDAALKLYRQALFLEPDFIMAHFSLATLLKQLQRKGVKRHLRNVVTLLENFSESTVLPQGEGLTGGRLLEIARNLMVNC
ncbi:hypothetical protein KAI46_10040 [bacterium]|nr:hypothetical protein [bacterium]